MNTIGNRNDEFLKSLIIEVKAGTSNKTETTISKCDYILTLSNEYNLFSCFPSDQTYTYLKIVFKKNTDRVFQMRNHELIKVKSLKLVGKKEPAKTSKITVQDAAICWYFEMLSSMAIMQSQLIPGVYSNFINITKFVLIFNLSL